MPPASLQQVENLFIDIASHETRMYDALPILKEDRPNLNALSDAITQPIYGELSGKISQAQNELFTIYADSSDPVILNRIDPFIAEVTTSLKRTCTLFNRDSRNSPESRKTTELERQAEIHNALFLLSKNSGNPLSLYHGFREFFDPYNYAHSKDGSTHLGLLNPQGAAILKGLDRTLGSSAAENFFEKGMGDQPWAAQYVNYPDQQAVTVDSTVKVAASAPLVRKQTFSPA